MVRAVWWRNSTARLLPPMAVAWCCQRLNLLQRFAASFIERRDPELTKHSVEELVAQRVYGLALGYEDLNDHEQLRHDPMLQLLANKAEIAGQRLAGKSTLSRLERNDGSASRYSK